MPNVSYAIRKVSLGERLELTQLLRSLLQRNEFLNAGTALDQTEAAVADLLARKAYLGWGLTRLRGLEIDGQPGSVELLIEKGPESLTDEIVLAIRNRLELSEEERKNY